MRKIACFLLILGLIFLTFNAGCRSKSKPAEKSLDVPVKMTSIETRKMARKLHTSGRLFTKKVMKLSFKISGIIRKIYADEGMSVRKGQILAMLDLSEINSQVKQAQSAFEKARRDLERVESLYQKKAATLEQYQNVQTAFQVAQSRLNAAEFNLRYSEIRAPSRGRILKRLMEENELAGAGIPIFFFASTEQDWIVRVGVSDRDLVRLRLDDPALVTFDAYPGEKFKAKVTEIVESADQMTGTYEVELKVDPAGKRLASGFVAKVDIIPSLERTYYVIPIEALVEGNGRSGYVFAVDTGSMKARRIPVTIGFLFEDKVAVLSGLEEISSIVADGAPYLTDGAIVKIVENYDSRTRDHQPVKGKEKVQ